MTLKNAPIKEALIDIQVTPSITDASNLEELSKQFSEAYPEILPINEGSFSVNVGGDAEPAITQTQALQGYMCRSSDSTKVLQLKLNSLTLSLINNYTKWEDFIDAFKEPWNSYREFTNPKSVNRIGVRFVNSIVISPAEELSSLFTQLPNFSSEITEKDPSELFSRAVFADPQNKLNTGILTQALTPAVNPEGKVEFILDADAFRTVIIEDGFDSVLDILNELRDYKNRLFFNSITSKLQNRFGEES